MNATKKGLALVRDRVCELDVLLAHRLGGHFRKPPERVQCFGFRRVGCGAVRARQRRQTQAVVLLDFGTILGVRKERMSWCE